MAGFAEKCCSIGESLLHLVYPPLCLYCHGRLENPAALFCQSCATLLELIDPSNRCHYCFGELATLRQGVCLHCRHVPSVLTRAASAFDYLGPAACLVKQLKYGQQAHLASGAASFLMVQYARLNWPMPDIIVPVPVPLLRKMTRGYNQSFLISQELGRLLQRPVREVIHREGGDYSQAGLSLDQRRKLNEATFRLNTVPSIADKTVLLVDDVLTSGATLRQCGQALLEGCPGAIYGLTVCRATR